MWYPRSKPLEAIYTMNYAQGWLIYEEPFNMVAPELLTRNRNLFIDSQRIIRRDRLKPKKTTLADQASGACII